MDRSLKMAAKMADRRPKRKRPWHVEYLAALVLGFALLNLLRAIEAGRNWQLLDYLPISVPPLYLLLSGAIWALIGLLLAVGLWFGFRPAWLGAQVVFLFYAGYYWLDRLWLAEPPALAIRWPFLVVLTILLLVLAFGSLWLPGGRAFFRK